FRPILISDIFINLDRSGIERVCSVFLTTRNPVMFPSIFIKIVGLKTAYLQPCESLAHVIQRPPRFGESHTPDPSKAIDTIRLILNVHDPGFVRHNDWISNLSWRLRRLRAAQKLQQRRIELRGLLYLRDVTAILDHHQLRAGDVFDESLADSERRQSVFLAPEREGRGFDRFDFAVEEIFAAQDRFDERIDRIAVAA